jgi:hypothetical protein
VGELCALRIGQVRLHDSIGTRLHIPDSKTETGIRDVQMSPDLVEAVVEHLDRLRRSGAPTGRRTGSSPTAGEGNWRDSGPGRS